MAVSVYNFIVFLQVFFPGGLSLQRTLYAIAIVASLYPLFKLHANQRREPRQPLATGWYRSIGFLMKGAFHPERQERQVWLADGPGDEYAERMCDDLEQLYDFLGVTGSPDDTDFFPRPRPILVTSHLTCIFCSSSNGLHTLRRRRKVQIPATRKNRLQKPEYDAKFIRVSKHGVWMDRRIAIAQENAILNFRSGWSNFAQWLSDTIAEKPRVTIRQSQRLYFEHFSRRLIVAHDLTSTFYFPSNTSSQVIAEEVRKHIGTNGGIVPGAMMHGCMDCTHLKRYKSDLLATGAALGDRIDADGRRGYSRLAVTDGKTIDHKICAVTICKGDLVNYKNGRFCEEHLDMHDICGIIPCGRPIHSPGALTCDDQAHKDWHSQYLDRFSRLSFPGVQRVIRKQLGGQSRFNAPQTEPGDGPSLRPTLPPLNGVPGAEISHTFRARTTYCLQTIQWACECPIGWGKCYTSESSSQVLGFINRVWENHAYSKPSFIAYDDACNLLRHIVTQDPHSHWIRTTKFIVDSWHYIGHRATDVLCCLWCNPAPTNGSQPDLVTVEVDDSGRTHTTRAFNTETAEQLNAWMGGFEAQLRQISATNYDFCVHVIMLLYKEKVDRRVIEKDTGLSDEFWDVVEGITPTGTDE
ncbi:hypothetical protein B0H17DRAFT_1156060 [Mycena rosella]|uniref:CxC6 like cysteine cluster associated with KDZ domain-containing protein n=1 Tax=Mycena rosella TaxID=1033263 RepID=A0AAD7GYT9_MYCRO|nr:hypothetical protein B0H17DRAFT_1156060 [Mycena rosella]